MEIIIQNGENFLLTKINEKQIDLFKKNNEKIIEGFEITRIERENIIKGINFKYIDNKFIFNFEEFNLKNTKQELETIKKEKQQAILKLASITDQINLIAGTLDIVVDKIAETNPELLNNEWIIESKEKINGIKNILNK